MKIRKYNIHTMGNSLLIEFQGDQRIADELIKAVERVLAKWLNSNGNEPKTKEGKPKLLEQLPSKKKRGHNFGRSYTLIRRKKLASTLEKHRWNLDEAAKELEIDVPGIRRRIKQQQLEPGDS